MVFAAFEELANPLTDQQGLALESRRDRARKGKGLDNDF